MNQRVMTLTDGEQITQIVSGTELMTPGEGGDHTRLLWATVPPFGSTPDITVTLYSDDHKEDDGDPTNDNAGTTFVPWAIQYRPLEVGGHSDLIAISSTNTQVGEPSPVRVFCSYLAIGDKP